MSDDDQLLDDFGRLVRHLLERANDHSEGELIHDVLTAHLGAAPDRMPVGRPIGPPCEPPLR